MEDKDTSSSLGLYVFSNFKQLFVEIFCKHLQSLVWGRYHLSPLMPDKDNTFGVCWALTNFDFSRGYQNNILKIKENM